jgi:hypothetical protein
MFYVCLPGIHARWRIGGGCRPAFGQASARADSGAISDRKDRAGIAMKPVSADMPDLTGQPPGASGAPSLRVKPPRARELFGVRAALVSFSVFVIVVAGAFLLHDIVAPRPAMPLVRYDGQAVGTIKLAPEDGFCRQMSIDNRTGKITSHGRLPCDKSPTNVMNDANEALKERAAGNRIDVVRDSFKAR